MADQLFREIVDKGWGGIEAMCHEGREETLHLEFKTLSDHSGTKLPKDDRRLIAKAICGLSNAEGGVLIIGITTERRDNIDVAKAPKPFDDVITIRNRIVSGFPEFLSPQHTGIADHVIERGGSGCLVLYVPPSDIRPHMSIPEHRYFRRGSDGTRLMEHGEVRDLMLAPKVGALELLFVPKSGSRSGFNFEVRVHLVLRNVGAVAVWAPYILSSTNLFAEPSLKELVQRRPIQKGTGLYTGRDFIIHVGDEVNIGYITLGLVLLPPHPASAPEQIVFRELGFSNLGKLRIVSPFMPSLREDENIINKPMSGSFVFGGGNVPQLNKGLPLGGSAHAQMDYAARTIWPNY